MLHFVELRLPDDQTLKVNPLQVGTVYADPERKNRTLVVVGGVKERVIGTEAEVLEALGWTAPSPPAAKKPAGQ